MEDIQNIINYYKILYSKMNGKFLENIIINNILLIIDINLGNCGYD